MDIYTPSKFKSPNILKNTFIKAGDDKDIKSGTKISNFERVNNVENEPEKKHFIQHYTNIIMHRLKTFFEFEEKIIE